MKAGYRDRDQGNYKSKDDRSRLSMPPGSHDSVANDSEKMFIKAMMAKLVKRME